MVMGNMFEKHPLTFLCSCKPGLTLCSLLGSLLLLTAEVCSALELVLAKRPPSTLSGFVNIFPTHSATLEEQLLGAVALFCREKAP